MTFLRAPGTVASAAGVALAVAATFWLVLQPCAYVGVTETGGPIPTTERVCASLLAVNGWWVLGLLSVPVALTTIGLLAAIRRISWLVWGIAAVLLGFCVIGAFSVGLYYMPSVVALVVTAVRVGRVQSAQAKRRCHPRSP
jgi:hypothetical protein